MYQTIYYKGNYIHITNYMEELIEVQLVKREHTICRYKVKSIHVGKLLITKYLKENRKYRSFT